MELQLVNYRQAKALKGLGFNIKCYNGFLSTGKLVEVFDYNNRLEYYTKISCYAPTLELVAKWLRDEKGIFFEILSNETLSGYLLFYKHKKILMHPTKKVFQTYEGALSVGIDKAIEIINTEKYHS